MSDADWDRWYARYGDDYQTLEAARADYQVYLAARAEYTAIFAMGDAR